ncbi:MAG: hypothetical protein RLZZ130_948, partial [Pseudomonadota bacterium]
GNSAANLRDLKAVCQAHTIMVAVGRDEYLRFVAKPPEGNRMNDAITVTLEYITRATNIAVGLWMKSAAAVAGK